jgi:hypothetical protein
MTWRHYLVLAVLGLAVAWLVAAFQPAPGYLDADYYYADGLQLANHQGFSEPFLWNYLDDPSGLPHPSNAYWMPLASLVTAAGAVLFGPGSWSAARIGFLAVAAAIPPMTAALAWSLTSRRVLAMTAGLLAVFSGFYLPFLPVTDTFGLYMLLGGLFFLLVSLSFSHASRNSLLFTSLFLGVIAGLMHLSRADGLLWLLIALVAVLFVLPKMPQRRYFFVFCFLLLTLAGYLLVMTPWFLRNISAFGTPLSPGGSKMLWLTSYNQLFAYPASQLTFASWWHSGLLAILKARLWALGLNLANAVSVQGEVFLFPLIGIGVWHLCRDRRVQLAVLAWLVTLAAMTVAFPYAGARGGFFHSGAALQPVWWVLAPVGLEQVIAWARQKRGWDTVRAGMIFRPTLVGLALLLTVVIAWGRLAGVNGKQAWGQESIAYSRIEEYLVSQGMTADDVVVVANPPGFYLASGNPAIAVPDGNVDTLLTVARKYGASYLILEAGSVPAGLSAVYNDPQEQSALDYLGQVGGAHIFSIRF